MMTDLLLAMFYVFLRVRRFYIGRRIFAASN
jgi:hypothetical protein